MRLTERGTSCARWHYQDTPDELCDYKMAGERIPDTPTTLGRNKVVWRPNADTKITLSGIAVIAGRPFSKMRTQVDLVNRPKGHRAKLELAHQLRAQTTFSVAWMAQRLSMGSRAHLAWLLKGPKTSRPAAAWKAALDTAWHVITSLTDPVPRHYQMFLCVF